MEFCTPHRSVTKMTKSWDQISLILGQLFAEWAWKRQSGNDTITKLSWLLWVKVVIMNSDIVNLATGNLRSKCWKTCVLFVQGEWFTFRERPTSSHCCSHYSIISTSLYLPLLLSPLPSLFPPSLVYSSLVWILMPFERCVLGARRTCGCSCVDVARYVGRPWQSGNETGI